MTVKLTETAIAAAAKRVAVAGKGEELIDTATAGLRLRVMLRGKQWVWAGRDSAGSMRRFALGEYPAMGIGDARTAATRMRAEVKGGADPAAEARRKKAAAKETVVTLGQLVDLYGAKVGDKLKSWPEYRRSIRQVFTALIDRPLPGIHVIDLQSTLDGWPAPHSASAAARYLRPVLKWASAPGRAYVDMSLTNIRTPVSGQRRKRFLSREELARVLPVLAGSDSPYAACMRLMLMTLARRDEAAFTRWRDVDLEAARWLIPVTKNGQLHEVPLPRQAVELLRSIRPHDAKPEALVFATSTGGHIANWHRETVAIHKLSATTGWHRHDLRRTGATMLGELGEAPHIIEAALNHVSLHSQLAATYNRSRYRTEVAAALQRLADDLDSISTMKGK